MNAAEPLPNAAGAVDLSEVAKRADERDATEAAERRREAFASIAEHDRRMQRIFKGIISRPVRRRVMSEALARMADDDYEPRTHNYKLRAGAPRKRRGPGGGGKSKRA